MMRNAVLGLLFLLATGSLFAQQQEVQPDFSRDNLLRLTADIPEPPEREPRVEFGFGTVSFRALGTSWRFNYLPIMAPLSGTAMTTSRELPNGLTLNNAATAETPRTFRDRREMTAERRRIERILNGTADVKVRQ
jgi:hypothetical protein